MSSRLIAVLTVVAAAATSSCGGSSSESPWPVEPEGAAPGPEGESGQRGGAPGADVTDEAEAPPPEKAKEKGAAPQLLER
jgi:hypothetical protein